jgi:hypothetical protein
MTASGAELEWFALRCWSTPLLVATAPFLADGGRGSDVPALGQRVHAAADWTGRCCAAERPRLELNAERTNASPHHRPHANCVVERVHSAPQSYVPLVKSRDTIFNQLRHTWPWRDLPEAHTLPRCRCAEAVD